MASESKVADAGADRAERASECRQHQQILYTDPITGNKFWAAPPKMRVVDLKHAVPNLRAFSRSNGTLIKFEYISNDPIDESDARDLQCRAGWSDVGFGFYGLVTDKRMDGLFVSTWDCGASCE